MAKVTKTVTINAPVEKVFDYMSDPNHMLEFWPSLIEVKDVRPSSVGGKDFAWVYKMAGIHFHGASEAIEYVANQRMVIKSTKGINTRFVWTYELQNGGTKLTLEVEYTIPVPLLGKLAENFIVKMNEREAETMLENLKARMET
jgi:uncharacterized protein YndB with AHSA1/START domain